MCRFDRARFIDRITATTNNTTDQPNNFHDNNEVITVTSRLAVNGREKRRLVACISDDGRRVRIYAMDADDGNNDDDNDPMLIDDEFDRSYSNEIVDNENTTPLG